MVKKKKVIALESRLKGCKNVITLGARTNFSEYNREEASLIRNAEKIYYPTTFYADLFDSMGKKTFPSYHTYKCVQDKIKQTALFNLLQIPHPTTKVYYVRHSMEKIIRDFTFPFIAKVPRGSAMGRGVFLIQCRKDLEEYVMNTRPAYIQEYIKEDRDIRVVVIGKKVVHAYWRVAANGEFRSNVAKGGHIELDHIPKEAQDLALHTAGQCGWDDVGIDIMKSGENYYVLEANMKYGKEGFRKAGIDYLALMETMIEQGEI
jgi:ribosomal protein S6--L-glutamate ligase